MKAMITKFAPTAGFMLALAFTFNCFGSDESLSDKGNDISKYKTIAIGSQTWMAENLNYYVEGSKCHGDDPANCIMHGRLYDWESALKACPKGWRLPSIEEWNSLGAYTEKLISKNDWKISNRSFWWSASEYDVSKAYIKSINMAIKCANANRLIDDKELLLSVRCLKDLDNGDTIK